MIVELDGYKMIKFYESVFHLPNAPIYEKMYEHYLEEINSILYMKEEDATIFKPIIYPDGSTRVPDEEIFKLVDGYNYYFKYDKYINLIKHIISTLDKE